MKNKALLAAMVVIGVASVAYASFASTLTINGTGTAQGSWDVHIQSITRTSATGATDVGTSPSVATDKLTATFNVDLAYPGATATYSVVIANSGNVAAKLNSLTNLTTLNGSSPTYITYTIGGVAQNDVLAANSTVTATVTVTWNAADNTNANGASKSATINFGYGQNI